MNATTLLTDYAFRTVATRTETLAGGKQYVLQGTWTGTSEMGSLMGARVEAYPVGATSSSQRIRVPLSTRNHEGTENGLPSGTKRTVLSEGLLEVPEGAGGAWVIELRAQAGRIHHPEYEMHVTGAELPFDATPHVGGTQWRQGGDKQFGNPDSTVDPRPRAIDVLVQVHEVPAGTTQVKAYTGVEVSVESTGGAAPLRARLTSMVRQLAPDGSYHQNTKASTVVEINGTLHHYKVNQWQLVPVDLACGPGPGGGPRFSTKVYVEYLAAAPGDPERHGGVVHGEAYTGAYLVPWS